MFALSSFIALAAIFSIATPMVNGHARVTSPPIRTPGQAFQQKCGAPSFNSVSGDPTGHIEEQEPFNAGCQPTLCRGMLFQDQPASNVQKVIPGQAMAMGVDCTIPHGGPANVSLVDTTTGGAGTFIGSFLSTFDDFCPTSGVTPADQSNIQFKLPSANVIGNKCQSPGDCVVQLFWATPDFSQNYYYCVDVQVDAATQPLTTSVSLSATSPITSNVLQTSTSLPTTSVAADVVSSTADSNIQITTTAESANLSNSQTASTSSTIATTSSASLTLSTTEAAISTPTVVAPSDVTNVDSPSAPLYMLTITTTLPSPSPSGTSTPGVANVNGALNGGAPTRYSIVAIKATLLMAATLTIVVVSIIAL